MDTFGDERVEQNYIEEQAFPTKKTKKVKKKSKGAQDNMVASLREADKINQDDQEKQVDQENDNSKSTQQNAQILVDDNREQPFSPEAYDDQMLLQEESTENIAIPIKEQSPIKGQSPVKAQKKIIDQEENAPSPKKVESPTKSQSPNKSQPQIKGSNASVNANTNTNIHVNEEEKHKDSECDEATKHVGLHSESSFEEEKPQPLMRRNSSLKKGSIYKGFQEDDVLFRPEFHLKEKLEDKNEKLWTLMESYLPRDTKSIQKSIINHIEYTLARTRFDLDKHTLYQGTSLSVRDRLLEAWNDSQMIIKVNDPKRVYYLSLEFLLGRLLQNALINIDLEDKYREALFELGYKIEDLYDKENDPALGNGGLGRLAACYLDSLTTLNMPAWGYGIRYDYGIFKQVIENFQQTEMPDYWLSKGNPWEVMRLDIKYNVRFYGHCRDEFRHGKKVRVWEGGNEVEAIAYDTVIPGWNTFNCNTLRLWKSFPSEEFDFDSFNKGDYSSALEDRDHANYITSVLYPNDSTYAGKELRLKQQYFFCAATIQDIIRRFQRSNLPWSEFPNKNAMQLNDTHPAVAIAELLRVLLDVYSLEYDEAFDIVYKTFGYTNHTVLPEALEKWSVDLFTHLLPRHMELIYLINHYFLEKVRINFPKDFKKHERMSIIEESAPKMVRMANLCIVASHTVNGVAELHSNLLKATLFSDFDDFYPGKLMNVTNGVTPRRWIHCAFPELSALLTDYSGSNDWLSELSLLETLPKTIKENNQIEEFLEKFSNAKLIAKRRLVAWVKEHCNIDIDESFMFDVMVKRIHEYKRQFMNALYCVHRYLNLKSMSIAEREKQVKRVTFFGGKAAPGYIVAKAIIKLINLISFTINNDPETNSYFKVVYLPDYKVSLAQIIIPAADLSQHISTAGTEASGTSCMKFAMTGSLIIGTRDGANIEIAKEIGEDNIFFFGCDVKGVWQLRNDMRNGKTDYVGKRLAKVFQYILEGHFGDTHFIKDYIKNLMEGGDYYIVCSDFYNYLEAQERVDAGYKDLNEWYKKTLISISKMGFFSSDRSIQDYCDKIWHVKPVEIPKPSNEASKHVISSTSLKKLEKEAKNGY